MMLDKKSIKILSGLVIFLVIFFLVVFFSLSEIRKKFDYSSNPEPTGAKTLEEIAEENGLDYIDMLPENKNVSGLSEDEKDRLNSAENSKTLEEIAEEQGLDYEDLTPKRTYVPPLE